MVPGMEPARAIPTTTSTPPSANPYDSCILVGGWIKQLQTTALRISYERKSLSEFGTYQTDKQAAIVYYLNNSLQSTQLRQ